MTQEQRDEKNRKRREARKTMTPEQRAREREYRAAYHANMTKEAFAALRESKARYKARNRAKIREYNRARKRAIMDAKIAAEAAINRAAHIKRLLESMSPEERARMEAARRIEAQPQVRNPTYAQRMRANPLG